MRHRAQARIQLYIICTLRTKHTASRPNKHDLSPCIFTNRHTLCALTSLSILGELFLHRVFVLRVERKNRADFPDNQETRTLTHTVPLAGRSTPNSNGSSNSHNNNDNDTNSNDDKTVAPFIYYSIVCTACLAQPSDRLCRENPPCMHVETKGNAGRTTHNPPACSTH